MKFKIRTADTSDLYEIINLFESWESENIDPEYAKKYYPVYHDSCLPHEVFVGEICGNIIGVTGYSQDRKEKGKGEYWINWFLVHKDFIKHGYGEQLLNHVLKILKNKKARKIIVYIASNNYYEPAQKLYKDRGFEEEGIINGSVENENYVRLVLNFKNHN